MSDTGEGGNTDQLDPKVQEMIDQALKEGAGPAAKAGQAALAKQLGFESVEAMQKFVKDQKKAEKDKLDEAERAKADAAEASKTAEAATVAANTKAENADILFALAESGIAKEKAKKLIPNVRMEIEGDVDDASIAKAIKALQKDFPELFTTGTPPPPAGSHPTPPSPGAGKGTGAKSVQDQAYEILHLRHPQLKKT